MWNECFIWSKNTETKGHGKARGYECIWSFDSHVASTCVEVDSVVRKCLLIWYKNSEYSELRNLCQYCSLVIFYSWWLKFFGLFENLVSHFSLFKMKSVFTVLYRVGCLPYLFLNIELCGKGHSIFVSLTLCRDFALEIRRKKHKSLVWIGVENEVLFFAPTWCVVASVSYKCAVLVLTQ